MCAGVCGGGAPPQFFISVDSKRFNLCVRAVECAVTRFFVSADSKRLGMRQISVVPRAFAHADSK